MRLTAKDKPTQLYLATNLVNGKRYYGITCKSIKHRMAAHVWDAKRKPQGAFHKAIVKYGIENFSVTVVRTFDTYEDAIVAECAAIRNLRPEYNCTAGGDGAVGYIPSREVREKMSAAKRGKSSHMKGKRHTNESRQKMSVALKGKPAFWKGKKVPAHVHEAVRAGHSAWKQDKDAVRAMLSHARAANIRKVVCLNDGRVFDSLSDAALAYGLCNSSISCVCKKTGPRKMAGGLVFRYYGDHLGGQAEADRVKQEVLQSRTRTAAIARKSLVRPVICIDDDQTFSSITEASNFYGVSASRVKDVCDGRTEAPFYAHRAAGRRFRYVEVVDGV